ncbi:hypothetical protein HK102_008668, partial [Quaeritorhiza haematococci]
NVYRQMKEIVENDRHRMSTLEAQLQQSKENLQRVELAKKQEVEALHRHLEKSSAENAVLMEKNIELTSLIASSRR